jgi:hypothetical protein
MGVQAFEPAGARAGASDTEVELGPKLPLLGVSGVEARAELRILGGGASPALYATCSLEPGDGGDEARTRQPERRRERLAAVVVRSLLGHGRMA